MERAGNMQEAPGGARATDRARHPTPDTDQDTTTGRHGAAYAADAGGDAEPGGGASAAERALRLRRTLSGRRDVEALLAEAGLVRDAAAAEADVMVAEAQQIAEELVSESQRWAEQLTVEAHERAEEILGRARAEAAAVEVDAREVLALAEQERHDVTQARERTRGLVEDVEQALARLRAALGPQDDVRRAAGLDALFEGPRAEPADPGKPADPSAPPRSAEPSLAELFPEPSRPGSVAGPDGAPGAVFFVVPESERPALPEVIESPDGPARAEVPAEVPAGEPNLEAEADAEAGRQQPRSRPRADPKPERERSRRRHDAPRATAGGGDGAGSSETPPDEEVGSAVPRESTHRPLGWLFRSQAP